MMFGNILWLLKHVIGKYIKHISMIDTCSEDNTYTISYLPKDCNTIVIIA